MSRAQAKDQDFPPPKLLLRGPARSLRRNIILLSVAICLVATGVLASGGSTVAGVSLDVGNGGVLDALLLGLLAYWALSFLCHALVDITTWNARGPARGFVGALIAPFLLTIEIVVPLGAAALAAVALRPSLPGELGLPYAENMAAFVESAGDERAVERAEADLARADRLAETASPEDAEEMYAHALQRTLLEAERVSDPALLADTEQSLRERIHATRLDGLLHAARLAEFQEDLPRAIAAYQEARFFLANDEVADEEQKDLLAQLAQTTATLSERLAAAAEPEPEPEPEEALPASDPAAALPARADVAGGGRPRD